MKFITILFSLLICHLSFSQEEETLQIMVDTTKRTTSFPTKNYYEEEEEGDEQEAEFPGGMYEMKKFITKELVYPQEAMDKKLGGKVYLSFTIETTGELTDIKVLRGEHEVLNNEAIRVVSIMPNWTPGVSNGKTVRTRTNLPIVFTLD